jgi:hypothetical protein
MPDNTFLHLGGPVTMKRICLSLCFVFLSVAVAGCGRTDYPDQRFPLTGEATFDGEPIDWGAISFLPMAGEKQRVSGGIIQDGKYDVPEAKGANPGKYRVEIRWAKLTGKKVIESDSGELIDERKEGLPSKFHKDSELTVDVSEENTTFDFHLKSK